MYLLASLMSICQLATCFFPKQDYYVIMLSVARIRIFMRYVPLPF